MCVVMHKMIVRLQQNGDLKDEAVRVDIVLDFHELEISLAERSSTERISADKSEMKIYWKICNRKPNVGDYRTWSLLTPMISLKLRTQLVTHISHRRVPGSSPLK